MTEQLEPFPSDVLFAQIDRVWAIQDYAPRSSCVRLVGISHDSFVRASYNSSQGCQTYIIDLGWRDIRRVRAALWMRHAAVKTRDLGKLENRRQWLRIDFTKVQQPTPTYAYEAFADAEPFYLSIRSMSLVGGQPVLPLLPGIATPASAIAPTHSAELLGFHVGQGMCSLFHGGGVGYLLDAGAGVPVLRPEYRHGVHASGAAFVNELRPLVAALSSMTVILSHPDSDHWRLLDWDSSLLAKAGVVYLPAGMPALAFSAPAIKPKVVGLSSTAFSLNPNHSLQVLRSIPSSSDRNGECLITVVDCNGDAGLLTGDYVYSRMLTDADAAVVASASGPYRAIVVPHHGDGASAGSVPLLAVGGSPLAYFSAGTHKGYKHPTAASILAHQTAGFSVINKNTTDDVLKVPLLP